MMQFDPQSGWSSAAQETAPLPDAHATANQRDASDKVVHLSSLRPNANRHSDALQETSMQTDRSISPDTSPSEGVELGTIELVRQLFQRLDDTDRSIQTLNELKGQLATLDTLINQQASLEKDLMEVRGLIAQTRVDIKVSMAQVRDHEVAGLEARNLRLSVINKLIDKYEG